MARDLLGKYIVIKIAGRLGKRAKKLVGKIIETEAYVGPQDKAAHSYGGKVTPRTKVEYLVGGHIYIYLVYGIYWQLNITAGNKGEPECALIRAIEPERGDILSTNGPGKLCRYLELDKSFYGEDLAKSKIIWLEDRGEEIKPCQILASKRIGIDYAGPYWSKRKWRFLIKEYRKHLPKG
jgi:DNA-3-methyladenine glycosylase